MSLCSLMMTTLMQPKHVAEARKNICCVFDCIHFHKTKIYIQFCDNIFFGN
jgi:hypothetical protein